MSRSKRLSGVADAAPPVWGPTSVKKRKPGFRMPSTASVFPMSCLPNPPPCPLNPQSRGLLILVFGGPLAVLVSVVMVLIADRWDPSFRTPHEVEALLGAPVLAALPKGVE